MIEFVKRRSTLDDMIAKRVEFLTAYQNAAYAAQYKALRRQGARPRPRSRRCGSEPAQLTEAVARYLFKLMAYKDEYEVARLHTDTGFLDKIAAQFEGQTTSSTTTWRRR